MINLNKSRQVLKLVFFNAYSAMDNNICLWGGFLCGGLWFGYWIKQGAMQMVHMTLFMLGIGTYLLFNQFQK